MLEVEDINKIINDELIRRKLLKEDDSPIISIYQILIHLK